MANRAQDWRTQAGRDLAHAERSATAGEHDWACFAAQQAAEKAVKALHLHFGQEAWGHVVARLFRGLPENVEVPGLIVEKAQLLDTFYIPTRYPNSHAEGAPFEQYNGLMSGQAIGYAREILEFVDSQMAQPRER